MFKKFKNYLFRYSLVRLLCSVIIGLIVGLLTRLVWGWEISVLMGWNVGALFLLAISFHIVHHATPEITRRRASSEDSGRNAVFALVSLSSAISLFASMFVLRQAKSISPHEVPMLVIASLGTVFSSWFLTHVAFLFRYAHLYYREDGDGAGGLDFPGKGDPDDYDFAYFSFTIGMTFQVSDVTISDRTIRRHVLYHGLLSFAYNTMLIALALNILVGIIGD